MGILIHSCQLLAVVKADALLLQGEPVLDPFSMDLLGVGEVGVIQGLNKVLSASQCLPVCLLLALKFVLSMLQ